MALNKAKKAILKAKYGEEIYELLLQAENVIVTENGEEISLADKLANMVQAIDGKATPAQITSAINTALGTIPEGATATTVYGYISEAIAALDISSYAKKTALETLESTVSGVSEKVNILIGTDTDKSARAIAAEEAAKVDHLHYKKVAKVDDIDPSAEGADKYIYLVPKGTGKNADKYDEYMVLDGAVEKVGDWDIDLSGYATNDALDAVAGRVTTAEGKITTLEGKVQTLEGDTHTHANKTVLDGITAAKVQAWDANTTLHVGATQPANMKNGDIWLQTFTE